MDIDISELLTLVVDLEAAGPKGAERAKIVVSKTEHDTVAEAKNLSPVDTGFLMSSISSARQADGLGFEAGPTAEYGHYVEFGTSRMSPQPYMIPAFDKAVEASGKAFEQVVGNIL